MNPIIRHANTITLAYGGGVATGIGLVAIVFDLYAWHFHAGIGLVAAGVVAAFVAEWRGPS